MQPTAKILLEREPVVFELMIASIYMNGTPLPDPGDIVQLTFKGMEKVGELDATFQSNEEDVAAGHLVLHIAHDQFQELDDDQNVDTLGLYMNQTPIVQLKYNGKAVYEKPSGN